LETRQGTIADQGLGHAPTAKICETCGHLFVRGRRDARTLHVARGPEEVGSDLALLERGNEDTVWPAREQPREVPLRTERGSDRRSSPSSARMSKA